MKNVNKMFLYTYCFALMASCTAFAHDNNENYSGSMKSIPYATITFDSNSSALSESDKNALRSVVEKARSKGSISEITIAAWSDKSLPRQSQRLTDSDRDLAISRSSMVSDFLKNSLQVKADMNTYNMAEGSNWMARMFHTSDSELKSLFSKKGAQAPVTNAEFEVIKNEGAPSEAVIVIQNES